MTTVTLEGGTILGVASTTTIYSATVEELYSKEAPILIPYPNIFSNLGVSDQVDMVGGLPMGYGVPSNPIITSGSATFKAQDAILIIDNDNQKAEINYVVSHVTTTLILKFGVKQNYANNTYLYRVPRRMLIDLGTSSHNFAVNGYIDADTHANAYDDRAVLRLMHTNGGTVTFNYGNEYYQVMINKLSIKEESTDTDSATQYRVVLDLVEAYKS